MESVEIEKKSLEAHVEICAVRYNNLELQFQNLENRMDKLEIHLLEIKDVVSQKNNPEKNDEAAGPYKMMLAIGTTIGGALIGILGTLVVHIK